MSQKLKGSHGPENLELPRNHNAFRSICLNQPLKQLAMAIAVLPN